MSVGSTTEAGEGTHQDPGSRQQMTKLGLYALSSHTTKNNRARNELFLYKVSFTPPQENQTLCLTLHCSLRHFTTGSHIIYPLFFFLTPKELLHCKKILNNAVRIQLKNGSMFKMKNRNKEQYNRYYVQ